jgi:hypothetical protein
MAAAGEVVKFVNLTDMGPLARAAAFLCPQVPLRASPAMQSPSDCSNSAAVSLGTGAVNPFLTAVNQLFEKHRLNRIV